MNRAGMAIVVGAFFCMSAAAQAQTGAQAGAQSSSQASVQAGRRKRKHRATLRRPLRRRHRTARRMVRLAAGTAFNAALSSPIDSKKCKPGDPVNAHTTEAVKVRRKNRNFRRVRRSWGTSRRLRRVPKANRNRRWGWYSTRRS